MVGIRVRAWEEGELIVCLFQKFYVDTRFGCSRLQRAF